MKLILSIVLVVLVFWGLRALRRSRLSRQLPRERPVERMVTCESCGLNQPLSESVERQGRFYCCPAHADQDRQRTTDRPGDER